MALPLTLPSYLLTAFACVEVTIIDDYYTAQVFFYAGETVIYTSVLTEKEPKAILPDNLQTNFFDILSGTIELQIPTDAQNGTVTLDCTYRDFNTKLPQPVNAVVAAWNIGE